MLKMDNNKTIYAVMETDYSYWDIKGYFTNEKEAEKYVLAHPETRLHIERLKCFDGKEPQNNKIQTLYEHFITFDTRDYEKRKKFTMRNEPDRYFIYTDSELRKDTINDSHLETHSWITFTVNQKENNRKLAEKIAQDKLAQYLAVKNNID